MKIAKLLGIAVGVLLILIGLAAVVVASKFDAARLKQEAARVVLEQQQRYLRIDGDLALSYFPSVGLKLGKASLSERGSDREFAAVDGARIAVRLFPLLSGQLVVERIELSGVRASIVRHKDGSLNVGDLISGGKEETSLPLWNFDIAGIALEKSAISYTDETSGQSFRLSDITLNTGRLAKAARGTFGLRCKVEDNKPEVKAVLSLGGDYRYDLDKKQYAFEGIDFKGHGEAFGFEGLDLALGARNLELVADRGQIEIGKLSLKAKGRVQGDALEVDLAVPELAVSSEKSVGQAVTGTVKLAGKERRLDGRLELSGLEGTASSIRVANVGAKWDLKQGERAVKGAISGALQGNLETRIFDVPKLAGELEIEQPGLPTSKIRLPLEASIHADLARSNAAGSLSSRLDDSSIQAKWQVSGFTPPSVGFDLAVDKLNVDRYLSPKTAAPGGGEGAPGPQREERIDLSFLKGLDLKGSARIGFLQFHQLKLTNLNAGIRVRNGRMDIDPISANLYEGSLAGALSAQADGNRIALRQSLSNVSIEPLLKDVAQRDILEGRGHVSLDVSAGGPTVSALKQSLAGSAALKLRDGAIKGINLAKTLREAKATLSGKEDAVVSARRTEKTDFSELNAVFKIAGGVAHNDDLSVKSPFLRATGAGDIDLGKGRINYLAKATVVGTAQGQAGRELEQFKGLTVPVRLAGPFDDLSYRLELGPMVAEAAKQQVQRQIEKQLDKKGLGGALKGLFK